MESGSQCLSASPRRRTTAGSRKRTPSCAVSWLVHAPQHSASARARTAPPRAVTATWLHVSADVSATSAPPPRPGSGRRRRRRRRRSATTCPSAPSRTRRPAARARASIAATARSARMVPARGSYTPSTVASPSASVPAPAAPARPATLMQGHRCWICAASIASCGTPSRSIAARMRPTSKSLPWSRAVVASAASPKTSSPHSRRRACPLCRSSSRHSRSAGSCRRTKYSSAHMRRNMRDSPQEEPPACATCAPSRSSTRSPGLRCSSCIAVATPTTPPPITNTSHTAALLLSSPGIGDARPACAAHRALVASAVAGAAAGCRSVHEARRN
eukprot:scaffold580_cov293-Prasinococcus_capsulatus_cf.AAC.4